MRHSSASASTAVTVRLACVKHAASVRSEPGSNSPLFREKFNPVSVQRLLDEDVNLAG